MKKKVALILVIFLSIGQLSVLISMIANAKKVVKEANRIVYLECRPYDPYDPFKGRYIRLSFAIESVKISDMETLKEVSSDIIKKHIFKEAYCLLEKKEKFHVIKDVLLSKPEEEVLFIKARINSFYSRDEDLGLSFSSNQYYLQEELALEADKMSNIEFQDLTPYVVIALDKNGNSVIKSMKVKDDVDIEDYLIEIINSKKQ